MHFYSDWQRCSHVYGAVGVSFSDAQSVVVIASADCVCGLSCFAGYMMYNELILINVSDFVDDSESGLRKGYKTSLLCCFCFIKVAANI